MAEMVEAEEKRKRAIEVEIEELREKLPKGKKRVELAEYLEKFKDLKDISGVDITEIGESITAEYESFNAIGVYVGRTCKYHVMMY